MRNPIVIILGIIIILIILIIGIEKDEVIQSLSDLIERRQVRYATSSAVTYTRPKVDADGEIVKDENGNPVEEKVKPLILFTKDEIDELLYTSYLYENQNTPFPYNFETMENARNAYELGVSWLANQSIKDIGAFEDPCYNQILYGEEKNEIADFLSSAGIDTDEIKNSSEVDSSDQLQVSSYFVKYCINAEKQNFNSIDWSTGDDSGNYSFPEKEEFSSEDDYNTKSQKTKYNGNGSVIPQETPDSDMRTYLKTDLKIPDLEKYPIAEPSTGQYEINLGVLFGGTYVDSQTQAESLMHYVSMTDGHLIKWIVPFALLADTNGDYQWVKQITEDAQPDVDITLYYLMKLDKEVVRQYFMETDVYYTYDRVKRTYSPIGSTGQQVYRPQIGTNIITNPNALDLVVGGYTETSKEISPQITEKKTGNTKDEEVRVSSASRSEIPNIPQSDIRYNDGNQVVVISYENIQKHVELKKDGAGNYIIAKDDQGKEMLDKITVNRVLSLDKIVPQIVKCHDMYTIDDYTYMITPINEDDEYGDTENNNNAPIKDIKDNRYGVRTSTTTFHENLSASFSETKTYQLSYLPEDQQKNMHITRIEWAQDYGRLVEGEGASNLVGSDNLEKIWNFLKMKGCSDIAAAGIIGNIGVESGGTFKGTILQNHIGEVDSYYQRYSYNLYDGVGAGICQWTYWSRKLYLKDLATRNSSEWYDLGIQLQCLWNEMNGLDGASKYFSAAQMSNLNNMTDIATATKYFMDIYERPGIPHLDSRINYANGAYNLYAGKTTPSSNSSSENNESNENNSTQNNNANQNNEKTYDKKGDRLASYALGTLGLKYENGGQNINKGVDQPGLVKAVYSAYGYPMPSTLLDISYEGKELTEISVDKLAPGDIVLKGTVDQPTDVGIYIGGGKVIAASNASKKVEEFELGDTWTRARRVLDEKDLSIGAEKIAEGKKVEKANSELNVIFGAGNIYPMYPNKTSAEKQETFMKYEGTRTGAESKQVYPKGYSREDLIVAFEYIQDAYRNVIGSDDDPFDLNAAGGEGTAIGDHYHKTYTMGGRTYYNLIQPSYGSNYRYGGKTVAQQGCTIIAISIIAKAFGTDNFLEKTTTGGGKYTNAYAYVVSDLNQTTKKNWDARNGQRAGGNSKVVESDLDQSIAKGYPVLIECLGAKRGGTPTRAGGFTNGNQHWMVLCDVKVENGQKYYYIETLLDSSTGWFTSNMLFANLNRYYVITN